MNSTSMIPTISSALAAAVGFLQDHQTPHGEWPTLYAQDPRLRDDAVFVSSPYCTTYVLYALDQVRDDPRVSAMCSKARGFLLDEMQPPGLWQFFGRRDPKDLPIDLDDTACASFALSKSHDAIAQGLNRHLILAHRDREGRFVTFLTEGAADVDALVNANVLLLLGDLPETAAATDFLCRVVLEGREGDASTYHVEILAFYYVLLRALAEGAASLEPCRGPVVERVLAAQEEDGAFGGALETAFALTTLVRAGYSGAAVDSAQRRLLAMQRTDGSWPASAFFIDFEGGFFGSPEVTTGLAIEALARAASVSGQRSFRSRRDLISGSPRSRPATRQ